MFSNVHGCVLQCRVVWLDVEGKLEGFLHLCTSINLCLSQKHLNLRRN